MALTPLSGAEVPASGNLDALVDDVWARIAKGLDGKWPPWALPSGAPSASLGPLIASPFDSAPTRCCGC